MPEYQLEIKQLVSCPRCRIYRELIQTLIADRGVRTDGRPGLFCYTVLCSYANFRTSYLNGLDDDLAEDRRAAADVEHPLEIHQFADVL